MKIGFSILSHKKTDYAFTELLQQLEKYPNKEISIHHDFSQAEFDVKSIADSSAELVQNHIQTAWSHVNNIEAILRTFELLYAKGCTWFVTLSANCYPIKKHSAFIDFLQDSTYDGYMECNNINEDALEIYSYFRTAFNKKSIFSYPFFRRNGQFYMKPFRIARKAKESIFNEACIPYHGSDWFMINRESMEYILNNKTRIHQMVQFLREVNKDPMLNVCPPEVVFQTLLANNRMLTFQHNNYRYIDWQGVTDWHPNTLTISDFEAIKKSNAFFARKLDAIISKELIEKINFEILHTNS